jgi:hypothetical protein
MDCCHGNRTFARCSTTTPMIRTIRATSRIYSLWSAPSRFERFDGDRGLDLGIRYAFSGSVRRARTGELSLKSVQFKFLLGGDGRADRVN